MTYPLINELDEALSKETPEQKEFEEEAETEFDEELKKDGF